MQYASEHRISLRLFTIVSCIAKSIRNMHLTFTFSIISDKPIVSVDLGSNLNASFIKEGMDVYLECNVQANPKVEKVIWMRNVSGNNY